MGSAEGALDAARNHKRDRNESDAEFDAAKSAEDVRAVFKKHYSDLGWKRLCRLFVLQYGVDALWPALKKNEPKKVVVATSINRYSASAPIWSKIWSIFWNDLRIDGISGGHRCVDEVGAVTLSPYVKGHEVVERLFK